MRSKRTVYSDKHRQMAELRAEAGVLARTEDILAQKYDDMNNKLVLALLSHCIRSVCSVTYVISFST